MRQRDRQRQIGGSNHLLALLLLGSLLAAAAAAPAFAQSPPAVFISSNPIGAVVIVDGKTIPARTPILLRDLAIGSHSVEIARRGYAPYRGRIEVVGEKPVTFNANLKERFIDPMFSPQQKVIIDGKTADYAQEQYQLPSGEYRIDTQDGVISIKPVFPAQQIMQVVDLATGALATASVILVAEAVVNTYTQPNPNNYNNNGNNGGAVGVWVVTGFAALSDVFLHIRKARYLKAYAATAVPLEQSAAGVEKSYSKAQELLASGDLGAAAELYIQIIRHNSDSLYYPRALYQLAKIHAIQGDNMLATAELRIILDKYPLPDLYDRTCKSLADISNREGDYKNALAYLDKMVFLDPLFPRAQILEYRTSIEKKMSQTGAGS